MAVLAESMNDKIARFPLLELEALATALLTGAGMAEPKARAAAQHLIIADLRGVESHGVARLSSYVARLKQGLIDPDAEVTVERELGSTLSLNGNNALGLLVGPEAMRRTIAKAQDTGICLTTVRGSNHFGIAGAYPVMATEAGLGGMAMTNAGRIVVPANAKGPMLGTNPIAFAVPTASGQPLCVDVSTSTVAYGKIEIARRAGVPIPLGWAIDKSGAPTSDPFAAAGLTTLGGSLEQGSHKGYGLSLMVETFCGPLAGNKWGNEIAQSTSTGAQPGIGHMFMAWRIDAFRDSDLFLSEMDAMLNELRAAEVSPFGTADRVLVPGDPEFGAERYNREHGVPVRDVVLDELAVAAATVDVPFTLRTS